MRTKHSPLAGAVLGLLALAATGTAQIVPPDMVIVEDLAGSTTGLGGVSDNSRGVILRHLDDDLFLDLFFVNMDQDNTLYWGNGDGTFVQETIDVIVNDGARNSRGVAAADFDADGDIDIFVANSAGQKNLLYLNKTAAPDNAPRTFELVTGEAVVDDMENSRQAAFGDVDGDGDLDLYVTNFNGQDNALYLNNLITTDDGVPTTLFERATVGFAGDAVDDGGNSYGVALGDIDGDTDLDLFVANHSGTGWQSQLPGPVVQVPSFLYVNNTVNPVEVGPLYTRVTTGEPATLVGNSMCAEFADYDDDGDLDLYVGQTHGSTDWLLQNQGGDQAGTEGEFVRIFPYPISVDRGETAGCRWADIDLDGDLDLLVANRAAAVTNGRPNLLYLNGGEGPGTLPRQRVGPLGATMPPTTPIDVANSYAIDVGDINGDTRPDVVVANFQSPNYVYRNDGRQFAEVVGAFDGNGTPRFGYQGNLIAGEQNKMRLHTALPVSPALLMASFTFSLTPFNGGTMAVDYLAPSTVLSPIFFTDGAGEIEASFTVGAVFAGAQPAVFAQWLAADPGVPGGVSLSNAMRVGNPLLP